MSKNNLYLVGVDGSEWGARATAKAVQLAKSTGAEVVLLSVIPWSGTTPLSVEQIASRPLDMKEEETSVDDEIFKPLLDEHADSGVTIKTLRTWGHAVEEVHKQAKELKASMIFVGRRGRSRVVDLVLGSVANAIAHKAGVPIVLVP